MKKSKETEEDVALLISDYKAYRKTVKAFSRSRYHAFYDHYLDTLQFCDKIILKLERKLKRMKK